MADETRQQPVAIRVTRPYATPDEFLDHEIETLTRTSVTLIGAQPRPKGVILRFEVALGGGGQLLRGEGRVVGYKENALGDQPGLVLRFTRLDTKSKALVDRAAAIREARARAALQAAMGEETLPPSAPSSVSPGSLAPVIGPMSVIATPPSSQDPVPTRPTGAQGQPAARSAPPPPPMTPPSFDEHTFASAPELPTSSERPDLPPPVPPSSPTIADPPGREVTRPLQLPTPAERAAAAASEAAAKRGAAAAAPAAAPGNRDELLQRLRERAQGLSPDRLNALVRR